MQTNQTITHVIVSTAWIYRVTLVHHITFASIVTCFLLQFSKQCLVGKNQGNLGLGLKMVQKITLKWVYKVVK